MGSYPPSYSQSTRRCLMLFRSQQLSGPEELCVGPQQMVGSSFQSLEPGTQAGEGNPRVCQASTLAHWGFQLLWRWSKANRP